MIDKDTLGLIAIDLRQALQSAAPSKSGDLRVNIVVDVTDEGLSISMPQHGKYVEFGCFFDKNTLITTEKSTKKLTDLKLGELIKTETGFKKLIQKDTTEVGYPIYEIEVLTENGKKLRLTEDHPVKTNRGWKKAKDLKQNDMVFIDG